MTMPDRAPPSHPRTAGEVANMPPDAPCPSAPIAMSGRSAQAGGVGGIRAFSEEGRTRGAEILEVVFRGRKISEQDEAVYVVSVIESREIENVVLAFLGRRLNSTESLPS